MKLWKVLARNSHVYPNKHGMEMQELKSHSPTCSDDSGRHSSDVRVITVVLQKKVGKSLGIVLSSGNSELDPCPSISSFRPGSVALTSDNLAPGDRIYSVNGINTSRMRPDDVSKLLENVDGNALLEIHYSLPNYASQSSLCLSSKLTEITLERVDGSLGITLRGGVVKEHPHLSRPLVITHVRPNGPAHRSGLIRVGDRVLKVDHQALINKTLLEAQQVLKDNSAFSFATLTIEYDVSIMESVKYAQGPLLVEIDRQIEEDFGLALTNCCELNSDEILTAGYFIEHVVPASTADRCGALNIGDQILAIDDLILENWNGSTMDAERLLRRATKLQLLPYHTVQRTSRPYTSFSTLNSRRSRNRNRKSLFQKTSETDSNFCGCSNSNMGVCHTEFLTTTLIADHGYGLSVSVGEHSDNRTADILISRISADSPAFRSGCLQVGDRIVSINHQPNLTLQEINSILELNDSSSKLNLEIEFDVADTIVPSSGIFTVKLPKRGQGLGITITAAKSRPDEPFIISEIKRGSIAHRIGTLHAGDRLLAIDNRPLDHLSLESAFDILQTSTNDIVTLKIEKTETENSNLFLDSVVYTVELQRYGGALGITISGSEDCLEPIVLSRLTEGGLAEKTGALHVGDRILAINSDSLENRPLSDAIRLLQNSGDRVQLKIARNIKNPDSGLDNTRCDYSSPGVLSVDSAVHSWDSNNTNDVIKDAESVFSEPISFQDPDDKKHDFELQFYSDAEEAFCPSPLPLPNYNFNNTNISHSFVNRLQGTYSNESMQDHEIYHVTLYKDSIYDDYGFSLSDGLYEKGVYVNRIRKGGPADIVGLLKPYDRIIQVNDTKTKDFDCCLTVPLIASAGDRIELLIARNPYLNQFPERDVQENVSKRSFPSNQNIVTKTL